MLVRDGEIAVSRKEDLKHMFENALFHVKKSQHLAATKIFFGENAFRFHSGWVFERWVDDNRNFATYLNQVHVDLIGIAFADIAKALKRCPSLTTVFLGVDERELVRQVSSVNNGYQRLLLPPKRIDPQLNLVVLRSNGMDALRALRIPEVNFEDMDWVQGVHRRTGPLHGGVLETMVAREMMQIVEKKGLKRSASMAGLPLDGRHTVEEENEPTETDGTEQRALKPFRFFDLPSELRNISK